MQRFFHTEPHLNARCQPVRWVCGQAFCLFLILSLTLAGFPLHAASSGDDSVPEQADGGTMDWQQTTADINLLATRYGAPSVSVAVIQDGEILYSTAHGMQDLESEAPATTATQYGIGSIVKSFTSGLIGSMSGDEMLDLDDSPAELVEGLAFSTPDLTQNLGLSHLLTQTSGLPFMDGSLAFFPGENQAELAPRLPFFDASCRVGDCWAYNNLNFVMLDMVAEAVSGKSKIDLLRERIFGPAGLDDTLASTLAFQASADAATGYGMIEGQPQTTAIEYLYGEHVYTTASDLARWIDVWMSPDQEILPSEYTRAAISTQAIENGAPPSAEEAGIYLFGYGYGWQTVSFEGHYMVRHGGNENGFSAHTAFIPAQRLGVVTLTNQQNSILPNIVNDLLMRRLLDLQAPEASSYPVVVNDVTALVSTSEARLAWQDSPARHRARSDLLGVYSANGYGRLEVELRDGVLMLSTPGSNFILSHREGQRFGLASARPIPMGIVMDFFEVTFGPGTLSMNIAAEPVVFTRND